MNSLQEELERVGLLLCSSLDSYLDTCHSVQKYYQHANNSGGALQALSASVASQFSLIDTLYKTKLKQARSILGQAVNSSVVVSIHSLPDEILVRIFHLIVGGRPCDVKQNAGTKIKFPKYPDLLSRVCTRWRQITLGSPTLWSHIDFLPFSTWSPGLEARAKACAARAGNSLLDIHVYESPFRDYYHMGNFISDIAPRIRSLEYIVPESSDEFDESVIERCFNNCVPGTFTELNIMNFGSSPLTFIRAAEDPDNIEGLELTVEASVLATLLLSVTVLRLNDTFLPWTHEAYHGLVELHLRSTSFSPLAGISTWEIVNILSSSSRLRVLHFGLMITDTHSEGSSISPVRLDELEVLSLTSQTDARLGTFLQLLSPGSKPLQLSLNFDYIRQSELPLLADGVSGFIARSNVAELRISSIICDTYQAISELISQMPSLRVLVMNSFILSSAVHPTPDVDYVAAPPTPPHLDALYLTHSLFELVHLQQFIRQHPPNELVFWNSEVKDGKKKQSYEELQTIFSSICPAVRCIGPNGPKPIPDWD